MRYTFIPGIVGVIAALSAAAWIASAQAAEHPCYWPVSGAVAHPSQEILRDLLQRGAEVSIRTSTTRLDRTAIGNLARLSGALSSGSRRGRLTLCADGGDFTLDDVRNWLNAGAAVHVPLETTTLPWDRIRDLPGLGRALRVYADGEAAFFAGRQVEAGPLREQLRDLVSRGIEVEVRVSRTGLTGEDLRHIAGSNPAKLRVRLNDGSLDADAIRFLVSTGVTVEVGNF